MRLGKKAIKISILTDFSMIAKQLESQRKYSGVGNFGDFYFLSIILPVVHVNVFCFFVFCCCWRHPGPPHSAHANEMKTVLKKISRVQSVQLPVVVAAAGADAPNAAFSSAQMQKQQQQQPQQQKQQMVIQIPQQMLHIQPVCKIVWRMILSVTSIDFFLFTIQFLALHFSR